ncbi:pentapeptide repeat-containing protein [Flavobacterium sp.]|uniref:pentapeptide repeat-containing protein n=1 Tax=Flavobacterium sp. TaxID=239 RepID=UPI002620BB65|nr:pentapeptide repeat-containing protein [Flavobacterium sp.]
METINLVTEIQNDKSEFNDVIINFDANSFDANHDFLKNRLYFKNCTFENDVLIEYLNKKDFSIQFHNCVFDGELTISNCDLNRLQLSFLKSIKNITIEECNLENIIINSNNQPLTGNIKIENCVVNKSILCESLNILKGEFNIDLFNEKIENQKNFQILFQRSSFDILNFSHTVFGEYSNFQRMKVINSSNFYNCDFQKSYFDEVTFGTNSFFCFCKFHSTTSFKNCRNIEKTNIKILNCLFTSMPYFNNSSFNSLEIENTNFEKKVSFDLLEVNTIKLYQVTFLQGAFFDDININFIENCDRKSIRTIKQEIQKAENRIDFNRFKNYEMATYYKELNWKKNFVDKSILYMTKISTDFGNSWSKALGFTLLSALLFFSLFFINENYNNSFDIKNWTQFTSGYFRFFLVTDFYNPLETDRVYLTNPLSWLIFIFGKIVIAFGIYEMIQSFRKFKA